MVASDEQLGSASNIIDRPGTKSILVHGGSILRGHVNVSAAKNSMLRLMVASLLSSQEIALRPFPTSMLDATTLNAMLSNLGKTISVEADELRLTETNGISSDLDWNGRSIRSTILIASALLARTGHARVPNPGGCAIGDTNGGERAIDLHLMIYERLGATYRYEGDYLIVESAQRLVGNDIYLPIRSTGATETGILCGALASGTTVIWGPHVRPEILDLIAMLREMGAKIAVHGQERIVVEGVEQLHGTSHDCISDNVEALSWAVAAAATGSDLEIRNFPAEDLEVPLLFLRAAGMRLFLDGSTAIVRHSNCYPIDIATGPYPGINSDMQPLFAAFALFARGESRITDLRFAGRYQYADQLRAMGAEFRVDGNMLRISGGKHLTPAHVRATDLRAGIALLIAALSVDGVTRIDDAWQIERGYDGIWDKLAGIGARVELES